MYYEYLTKNENIFNLIFYNHIFYTLLIAESLQNKPVKDTITWLISMIWNTRKHHTKYMGRFICLNFQKELKNWPTNKY